MSIFTAEELDTHIAAVKAALLANPATVEYTIDTGGSKRQVKRHSNADLRAHLTWLQSEKDAIAGNFVGRTYAKPMGRY